MTRDGLENSWLHFQLGLLHRYLGRAGIVAPVFLDVEPDDVSPTPLHVFQAARFNETDLSLLARQMRSCVASSMSTDETEKRFALSWAEVRERARHIPGPALRTFMVSLVLPDGNTWFRYDPSGQDGDWTETIQTVVHYLAEGPFGVPDVHFAGYHCLDVAAARWLEPPAVLSRVETSHIAIVHPQVVEGHSGSARLAAEMVRAAVKPNAAGLKVNRWQDHMIVGTNVV